MCDSFFLTDKLTDNFFRCADDVMSALDSEVFNCLNTKHAFGDWNAAYYYDNVHTTNGHAKASECLKCDRCENACPQHLPIRTLLEQIAEKFE